MSARRAKAIRKALKTSGLDGSQRMIHRETGQIRLGNGMRAVTQKIKKFGKVGVAAVRAAAVMRAGQQ